MSVNIIIESDFLQRLTKKRGGRIMEKRFYMVKKVISVFLTVILTAFCSAALTACKEDVQFANNVERVGADGLPVFEGDYVYFGSYPQSKKEESVTVGEERDESGYYLGSDGSYYAPLNGKYYKVEPIFWRIMYLDGNKAVLVSEYILDAQIFSMAREAVAFDGVTVYPNNYAFSAVRTWLNGTFFNAAFSAEEKAIMVESTVDNGKKGTFSYAERIDGKNNKYACSDTVDYVWLLSVFEATKKSNGFSTDTKKADSARKKWLTDYADALDVYLDLWWLRSPSSDDPDFAYVVETNGKLENIYKYAHHVSRRCGVVPVIKIAL